MTKQTRTLLKIVRICHILLKDWYDEIWRQSIHRENGKIIPQKAGAHAIRTCWNGWFERPAYFQNWKWVLHPVFNHFFWTCNHSQNRFARIRIRHWNHQKPDKKQSFEQNLLCHRTGTHILQRHNQYNRHLPRKNKEEIAFAHCKKI